MHVRPVFALMLLLSAADARAVETPEEDRWEETLEDVVQAVVSLRVVAPVDFDTESRGSSVGTGFVVDAERGLLLTNRHLVELGPVVAEAVLYNNEEIELEPIYRDPVHDFGFFRFDPEDVKYMDLVALPLAPERAVVGRNIRVVGNDAGSKISILDGTLSRVDRNAPYYGGDTHNDINTFYIQAASSTSGGSSGSPVVDINGEVIALNAGASRRAATAFYLPLDRVVPVLEALQRGEPVQRGTLQTTFVYTPYDELSRLGLAEVHQRAARERFPEATGMLAVSEVVRDGPAFGVLEPGDVLLAVDDEPLYGFVPLEEVLDASVGTEVKLTIDRGGQRHDLSMTVGDLHAITPDRYLEFGGGLFNEVSYSTARNHGLRPGGPYLAQPGYAFGTAAIRQGAVITEVAGQPTPDLDALETALESQPDQSRVAVRYHYVSNPRREQVGVVTIDRSWHPMRTCVRDADGAWPCTESAAPPPPQPLLPTTTRLVQTDDRVARKVAPSLVEVDFDIPYRTQGVSDTHFKGAGLIVDAEQGLVLVDRDTVPVSLGDAVVTVGGSLRVPAKVRWIHPVHNLAVLQYEPALLGDTPVQSAVLAPTALEPGDAVVQVALSTTKEVLVRETAIDRVRPLSLGTSSTPRFRDASVDGLTLVDATSSIGGVLADKKGRIVALWSSFWDPGDSERRFYGLPIEVAQMVVEPLREGRDPDWGSLEIEVLPIRTDEARDRGLPPEWSERLLDHDSARRDVL